MQTLNDELRDEFDIPHWTDGVVITEIVEESSAQIAGLQIGDVITGLNGVRVDNFEDFNNLKWDVLPGDEVVLDILRHDDEIQIKVIVGERPSEYRWYN
ncbi:PDZ domain-containing protein [bacterium]|nr:PDZ domain-containing protein [bacterium]